MLNMHHHLWAHVADLVFDCFYVANLTPGKQGPKLLSGIKECASWLGQAARCGLKRDGGRDCEPRLLQIRHFLGEMERQLLVANGLGALSDRVYHKLLRRTSALIVAFEHPRVTALFHADGRPRSLDGEAQVS